MIRHSQIRQTRVLHTTSWRGCLFRCYRRKTIICFVVLAIAFMVMIQISLSELNVSAMSPSRQGTPGNTHRLKTDSCSAFDEFYSICHFICSANRDVQVRMDAQGLYQRVVDDDDDISFDFLASIYTKVHAGWLQGRTTNSKVYFDELYISLSNHIQSKMKETEIDRWLQLQNLSMNVRKKIDEIQNPPNCNEAKLLVYDITTLRCGFGCHLHAVMFHFITSIYANRTFVLQSTGWNYDGRGWEHSLMPFGKCKYNSNALDLPLLSDETKHERVVTAVSEAYERFDWFVPAGILSKVQKIHPDPYAWWVGQFVAYAFRLQPQISTRIQSIHNHIGFTDKVVGLHIRWGDKRYHNESVNHGVDEYMDFVEAWFQKEEMRGENTRRVVFVATENSEVWVELKTRYPDYYFVGSGYVNERKNLEPEKGNYYEDRKFALESILVDLHFLSKCDYVVCTLSSEVCAATYELLMLEKVDAFYRLQTLDSFYIFQDIPHYRVTQRHIRANERELSTDVGDQVLGVDEHIARKVDGCYPVMNGINTIYQGDVPAYKLEVIVEPLQYSVFDDM